MLKCKINNFRLYFWALALIGYFFQSYYPMLSCLIIPCLLGYLFMELKNLNLKLVNGWAQGYMLYVMLLSVSAIVGVINNNSLSLLLRFFAILIIIPISSCIREENAETEWKILKYLSILKALTVVVFWVIVFRKQEFLQYRHWAETMGVGDVYIVNGLPRIQLNGTSLFVMVFGIEILKNNKITFTSIIMVIAALMVGNSAYVLGITLFVFLLSGNSILKWLTSKNWRIMVIMPLFIVLIIAFGFYSVKTWQAKSSWSNLIRLGQIDIFLNVNPISGNGLGNVVSGWNVDRLYNGNTYFELQTLYIYSQIGLFAIILFYILTFAPYLKCDRKVAYSYLFYLIFTFWNPYCFDSTHIFTILMLNYLSLSLSNRKSELSHSIKQQSSF